MKLSPTRAALFLAVALALPAAAQEWTLAPDAKAPTAEQQKQLDAAKAQLDAAAKRYAELAGRYGAVLARQFRGSLAVIADFRHHMRAQEAQGHVTRPVCAQIAQGQPVGDL